MNEIFSQQKFPSKCGPEKLLETAKKELSTEKFNEFSKVYESFFFFDMNHIAFHNATKANLKVSEPYQFNVYGQFPYDGYFAAKEFLRAKDPLSVETIKGVHKALLSKESITPEHVEELKQNYPHLTPSNSQGISDNELGELRNRCIWIDSPDLVSNLATQPSSEQNIQLANGSYLDPDKKLTALDGVKANPFLDIAPDPYLNPFYKGYKPKYITYPCVRSSKQLDEFVKKNPGALKPEQIEGIRKSTKTDTSLHLEGPNKKLTEYLVSNQFEKLGAELSKTNLTRDQAIEAVGKFYWNLVSIHPFAEGNGRTSRKIVQEILSRLGINPPVYKNWGEDIFLRQDSFVKLFKEAIATSDQIHENACHHFNGIDSLDLRPFFGNAKKPIRLNEFHQWAKDHQLDLDYYWTPSFNDEHTKALVSRTMALYKDHLDGKPVDFKNFQETKVDPLETILSRENQLIQTVSKPASDRLRSGFSWQSKTMTDHYTNHGLSPYEVLQEADNDPTLTYAGQGLYLSDNPFDSADFASKEGSLLVVDIPPTDKVVDLKDPEVLGKLYRNGIDETTIYHSPGSLVGYSSSKFVSNEWFAYKKPLEPSRIRKANWTDFNLSKLQIMRARINPKKENALIEMDRIITDAKTHYASKVIPTLSEKILWSPFGECLEKNLNNTYEQVDKQKCIEKVGVSYDFDPYLEECCMFSVPDGVFLEKATPDKCAGKTFTSTKKKARPAITLLPVGTPRTNEDKKLLEANHLLVNRDKKGNILSYSVLTEDQYLNLKVEEFSSLEKAQEYLYRIPHPINLERYAERLDRNQKIFENNLRNYIHYIGDSRPPENIFEWRWATSNLGKQNTSEIIKRELFSAVKASPMNPLGRYLSTIHSNLSIDVNFIDEVDLNNFVQIASIPQSQFSTAKPFPGFFLKLQKDLKTNSMVPVIEEGSKKEREQGHTIIQGYQNGIPIRLRIRYMEATPPNYAKLKDKDGAATQEVDFTTRQNLLLQQKNREKFNKDVLKELKDKSQKKEVQ